MYHSDIKRWGGARKEKHFNRKISRNNIRRNHRIIKKYILLPSSESELIQTGMWVIRSLSRVVKEKSVHIVSKCATQITY